MQIFRDKLTADERVRLDMLIEANTTLGIIYDDAELSLMNKDCVPFLKRLKAKRDNAREMLAKFENYLAINGKAVIS